MDLISPSAMGLYENEAVIVGGYTCTLNVECMYLST